MDSSDLAERRPNDPGRPSAKDAGPSDSTPPSTSQSNRPDSEPSSSSSQRHMPNNQDQQYPFNEVTPIVSNSGSPGRGYQATDNPKNTESRQGNGNPKAPAQRKTRNNDGNDPGDNPNIDQQGAWYSRVADRFSSVELENKGSVARDHLALERTFLAWLRTSLAFASIGIAVTQLFRLNSTGGSTGGGIVDGPTTSQSFAPLLSPSFIDPPSPDPSSARLRGIGKPLGTTFIGIAILVLLVGFHRYFESQYWIIRGKFPASRGSVAAVGTVTGALIITAFVVILAVAPNAVEK